MISTCDCHSQQLGIYSSGLCNGVPSSTLIKGSIDGNTLRVHLRRGQIQNGLWTPIARQCLWSKASQTSVV